MNNDGLLIFTEITRTGHSNISGTMLTLWTVVVSELIK